MSSTPASGRFLLRMSPALHDALRRRAKEAGKSLNRYCSEALRTLVEDAAPGQSRAWQTAAAAIAEKVGDELEGVVLFGSRAQGWDGPGSDVDLLLVLRQDAALDRERYAEWDRSLAQAPEIRALGDQVNPHFALLPAGPPGTSDGGGGLWLEVALHGVVLWQRSPSVARWIADARELIAEGALRRRQSHGQPYWVQE